MSVFIRLSGRVITNPIEWQEMQHQLRAIPARARRYGFMLLLDTGAFTRYEVTSGMAYRGLRFPYLSLADGGTALLYLLTFPYSYRTQTVHLDALPSIFMAGVLLSGMLVIALLTTWWAVRRDGALHQASP